MCFFRVHLSVVRVIEEDLGLRLTASIYALKGDLGQTCKVAFLAALANPSVSQQQVSNTL